MEKNLKIEAKIIDLIIDFLKDNEWHKRREIMAMCGVNNAIYFRTLIKKARLSGGQIIAGGKGYKLINNRLFGLNEMKKYIGKREAELSAEFDLIQKMWEKTKFDFRKWKVGKEVN